MSPHDELPEKIARDAQRGPIEVAAVETTPYEG
jgi:hypothetical protein